MAINRTDQNWPDGTAVDLEFCLKCYQWHSPRTFCAVPQPPVVQVESIGIPEHWTQEDLNRVTGEIFDILIVRGLLKQNPIN